MVRYTDFISTSTSFIQMKAQEFGTPELVCYVVYDTPVGDTSFDPPLPDYLVWKVSTFATSTGFVEGEGKPLTHNLIEINNDGFFGCNAPQLTDYNKIDCQNLHIMTHLEYQVLRQVIAQQDSVRRRLDSRFQKKYAVDELLMYIEAALVDINITPPNTKFWWMYTKDLSGMVQTQANPYTTQATGVPREFQQLLVQGTTIHALIQKGILEVDYNFSYSDQGISLTYDNMSHYAAWYDKMLADYTTKKKLYKFNHVPKGFALATIPEFGMGWFNQINEQLGNTGSGSGYGQSFFPFWTSGNSGRAQM